MNRNRLVIRLVLVIAVVVIFYFRSGGQNSPQTTRSLVFALIAIGIVFAIQVAIAASRRKTAEQDKQLTARGKDIDLFTKPKDS